LNLENYPDLPWRLLRRIWNPGRGPLRVYRPLRRIRIRYRRWKLVSGDLVSWNLHALVYDTCIPPERAGLRCQGESMWGVFLPVIVDPVTISQTGTSAEPDLGGFHIFFSNLIIRNHARDIEHLGRFYAGLRTDTHRLRTQNHMTMLGMICSG
jgi:hypothetical protein